jgi:hypothetical protein
MTFRPIDKIEIWFVILINLSGKAFTPATRPHAIVSL